MKKKSFEELFESVFGNYEQKELSIELFEKNQLKEILSFPISEICQFIREEFAKNAHVFEKFVAINKDKLNYEIKKCIAKSFEENIDNIIKNDVEKLEYFDNLIDLLSYYI